MDKLLRLIALLEKYWPQIEKRLPDIEAFLDQLGKGGSVTGAPVVVVPDKPFEPPVPPPSDASENFVGYHLGLTTEYSDRAREENEKAGRKPEDGRGPGYGDEASAERVQRIRLGQEPLWPTAIIMLDADPLPVPSQGPSAPVWRLGTPAGIVTFSLDQDGETKAEGEGQALVWMMPGLYRKSRGCRTLFRLQGHWPQGGSLVAELIADEKRGSNELTIPRVAAS